jgi:hypothetical protein
MVDTPKREQQVLDAFIRAGYPMCNEQLIDSLVKSNAAMSAAERRHYAGKVSFAGMAHITYPGKVAHNV